MVGDGFTVWDQQAYDTAVDSLLTSGLFAHDYYAANRDAFNLLRINVYSADSGVSTKTYDDDGNVTAQTARTRRSVPSTAATGRTAGWRTDRTPAGS